MRCKRDRRGQLKTEGDKDSESYWPITSLLSRTVQHCNSVSPGHSMALSVTDRISSGRKLRLTQDWLYLTWPSTYIISQRPPFSFNQVTASASLHRCVLCREISDWQLGQGSICNTMTQSSTFIVITRGFLSLEIWFIYKCLMNISICIFNTSLH